MPARVGLGGVRVLIIEDEALVAADTAEMLRELGCVPAGIAASVTDALAIINSGEKIDCATLDVRLDFEISGHVAGALMSKGIPFVVCSAYPINLPDFRHIPILEKPITKQQLKSWLLGANATNMAYMLSAQLAAMVLNVRHGFVSASALIYAPGTLSANAAGFATVGDVISEANTELGLHGSTLSGSPYRAYQEALKNALDNANNNKTFVQPDPAHCPTPVFPS